MKRISKEEYFENKRMKRYDALPDCRCEEKDQELLRLREFVDKVAKKNARTPLAQWMIREAKALQSKEETKTSTYLSQKEGE